MTNHEDIQPWYKQFWPWFIIAIPVLTVVANLWFIQMSMGMGDKVKDNYYKEGLAINKTVEADQAALRHGMTAELELDSATGEVRVRMPAGKKLEQLTLSINHPMEARYDMVFGLVTQDGQTFEGRAPKPINYARWYVQLTGLESGEKWRLRGEWHVANHQLTLEPSTAITVAEAAPILLEDRMAARYKIAANLSINAPTGAIELALTSTDSSVDDLSLVVRHATDQSLNSTVLLKKLAEGRYGATLPQPLGAGAWMFELSGTLQQHSIPWRLQGEWQGAPSLALQARSNL